MPNAVLVVDMVRGFLEPGHNLYCGDDSRSIIEPVQNLLRRESESGSTILFISDHHLPDDLEFQMFPVHCVIGTEEPEVIPALSEWVTDSNVVPKNRYSGFFNTDLDLSLKDMEADTLIVVGVVTNICVRSTVHDAFFHGYRVIVPEDCVAATGPREQESSLYDIGTHFGLVSTSEAVVRALRSGAAVENRVVA